MNAPVELLAQVLQLSGQILGDRTRCNIKELAESLSGVPSGSVDLGPGRPISAGPRAPRTPVLLRRVGPEGAGSEGIAIVDPPLAGR